MLSRSTASSSTMSSRLRTRARAYSLIREERRLEALRASPASVMKEKAPRDEPVLAVLVQRDDLHRDVSQVRRVLLEVTENRPAQHVGQKDVQRDGRRPVLAREHQRVGAARRGRAP